MIARLMIIALLAGATSAAAADRSFAVSGFDRVSATGSEDVTITTGKTASVVATGPQDMLDRLDVRVDGTTLKIGHKSGNWHGWGWSKDKTRIAVTLPALRGVSLAGSGNVTADHGTGPAFSASLAGSGDLNVAMIDSPQVKLTTAGSGDVTAAGKCGNANVSISGSGGMALDGLQCATITVAISGSGDVVARASQNANVRIAGSGDVKIAGGARCQSRTSGSGTVSCG